LNNFPLSGFREGGRGMGKNLSAVFGQEFLLSERHVTVKKETPGSYRALNLIKLAHLVRSCNPIQL
jgi:hypothetical protein